MGGGSGVLGGVPLNTFSLKPGEIFRFPEEYNTFLQENQRGLKFDAIANTKLHIQWFAIREIDGDRVLFAVTKPEYAEADPLREPRHGESDPI